MLELIACHSGCKKIQLIQKGISTILQYVLSLFIVLILVLVSLVFQLMYFNFVNEQKLFLMVLVKDNNTERCFVLTFSCECFEGPKCHAMFKCT